MAQASTGEHRGLGASEHQIDLTVPEDMYTEFWTAEHESEVNSSRRSVKG
jgi:hypothetical protein